MDMLNATELKNPSKVEIDPGCWSNRHAKLHGKLKDIRMVAAARAFAENSLLPQEATTKVQLQSQILDLKSQLSDTKFYQDRARKRKILDPVAVSIAHKRVYIEKALKMEQRIHESIQLFCMQIVTDVLDAELFIVRTQARPHLQIELAATVLGRSIVTREFLLTGGSTGTSIAYQPAASATRHIWISSAFARRLLMLPAP